MKAETTSPSEAAADAEIHSLLCSKVVDRSTAWGMAIVGTRFLWDSILEQRGWPLILLLAQGLAHNLLLLFRHPPRRITLNPFFWLIPVAGAHWHILYALFRAREGYPVVSHWVSLSLSSAGTVLFIWARCSLGRNFGMVPARREIVVSGPYQWIRHPIYTSSLIMGLGYHLDHYSPTVLAIWCSGLVIMVVKALMEEKFLAGDDEYGRYCDKVRQRFIPFLI